VSNPICYYLSVDGKRAREIRRLRILRAQWRNRVRSLWPCRRSSTVGHRDLVTLPAALQGRISMIVCRCCIGLVDCGRHAANENMGKSSLTSGYDCYSINALPSASMTSNARESRSGAELIGISVERLHDAADRPFDGARTVATLRDHFRRSYRQHKVNDSRKAERKRRKPIPRTPRDTSDNALLGSNKVSRVCGTYRRCPNLVTSRTSIRPRLKNVTQSI